MRVNRKTASQVHRTTAAKWDISPDQGNGISLQRSKVINYEKVRPPVGRRKA